jgi:monoamine oxidase
MKRDNNGNVIWDKDAAAAAETSLLTSGIQLPMQPRPKRFQIGVLGGGIAGLACCVELIKQLEYENIDAQVVLLEARSRLGGRLWTDKETFGEDSEKFPIELGASWIHGIDHNPLAALAKEANIDFLTTSENVQMLDKDMTPVDSKMDERMGKFFDDLLDLAAEDCWAVPDLVKTEGPSNPQSAIRWYSSVFMNDEKRKLENGDRKESTLEATGAPVHRQSSDRSIDFEVGKAIAKHKLREFSKLSTKEHRMLLWNTKNVEYALGANIVDLSMKYWDADERHAFEGDHVLLKQGYSAVVDHMLESLEKTGPDRFECVLDFPAGKVEYARKSATQLLGGNKLGRERKLVELSDSCCVSSQDGTQTKHFDFLVCAMPLGVLKESVARAGEPETNDKVSFQPGLPFSKIDSITNVGFGLLDKVYVQFPTAFWRKSKDFEEEDQTLFGNASGLNPHHYMFFDVGKSLGTAERAPAILMSLISGKEAVACENLSDKELVEEVMDTLRLIFSTMVLPEPSAFKITRWGQDQYSRGSYTFLPPGASDEDFQLLQSPINGNGDSLLLEASEIMRLFFAGEHTTALHPSMAHGAMLSGIRAAKEVLSTMKCSNDDEKDIDRKFPSSST